MSSRNIYLDAEQRSRAASLHRALQLRDPQAVEGELDYFEVVDPDTFEPCPSRPGALLVAAARFGSTRLIDNIVLEAP
jgi:pantoate--beta-alanine ligase